MANTRTFVGFGFGAIQAGLFLYEAHESGNFGRLVVAEVMPDVVDAVRANGGRYIVNVAQREGIEQREVTGVEIFDPRCAEDREQLICAVAEASEIATALPSVEFYGSCDEAGSVARIIADGLARNTTGRAIVYAAENHNRAAEILRDSLGAPARQDRVQCLNTVIGKMSGVVRDARQTAEQGLATVALGLGRCFLVEAFNRILVSKVRWADFPRGITVFEEKPDLLPFEEAKLYGHNATHALLGYLGDAKGYRTITETGADGELMGLAREAFTEESGAALCRRHAGVDALFTPAGYAAYADDLLERMTNPHLHDTVARVTRDPRRKLGWDDRLIGTMRVALEQGIEPRRYARGAAGALDMLAATEGGDKSALLDEIWAGAGASKEETDRIKTFIFGS